MDTPRELVLCDVRCFQGAQRGALRPITLLVGENSTGKTTFLGCYSVLHQAFSRPNLDRTPDFNEPPFAMGSFRDIARSRRGPDGHGDEFQLGLSVDPDAGTGLPSYELFTTFREDGSQPAIASLRFGFEPGAFLDGDPVAVVGQASREAVDLGAHGLVVEQTWRRRAVRAGWLHHGQYRNLRAHAQAGSALSVGRQRQHVGQAADQLAPLVARNRHLHAEVHAGLGGRCSRWRRGAGGGNGGCASAAVPEARTAARATASVIRLVIRLLPCREGAGATARW